jgi:membrane fusion protein, multidrug efflux system
MKILSRRCPFLLMSICLAVGCARTPPAADEEAPPAPVKAVKAQELALAEWTEILGTTQPLPGRVARISAPVEGRVLSVLRDANDKPLAEGQSVKAGTVIAQLDPRLVNEQKKQAEFTVRLAEIEVKRLETLIGTASSGQVPLASRVELQKARLSLEDTQSRLKALEERAGFYTLTSPIAGRLGLIQVVPGQTLAVGAAVAEVMDLSDIDVLCFVPPHATAHLALDQQARLSLTDNAPMPSGKVVFIAVQAQAETGNFAVKVRFPNPAGQLRANAIFPVQVQTEPEKQRLTIPEAALMEDQTPPAVVVIQEETRKNKKGEDEKIWKARKLQAVLGVRDRSQHVVEILGLEDPEKDPKKKEKFAIKDVQFVIEGGYGLHDGDIVKPEEAKEEK